jgi:hypothetical protein
MSIKLRAVYKLIPPAWYSGDVTEENIEDLSLFTGEMLEVRNNKVFLNSQWRCLDKKLKDQPSHMAYIKFYNTWLKVFYEWK